MFIVPDTQEAIVSQAQWDRVQELRKNKRRPVKAERQGLFSGLVYCADCGSKLHFATCKSFEGKQDHYRCSKYKSGRANAAHTISGKMYCGNWYWNGFRQSMRISATMWRVFRKNGYITAAQIRNETSGKIRSTWNRQKNALPTWM